ncbi:MAG: isoleucine--tRNA ligase [Ignavibacteria bacterium]|jgi:isoleucyl-tRNA synthetase|nr:isoleucine--tRNA ligase [Ignavibacteria bacterium]
MFKQLPEKINYPEIENDILKFWKDNKIFERTLEIRHKAPNYSFYEGPPTVNGRPGIHHMMARTIKDAVCRYKTMQGFYVRRQAGWDTHGLPVEITVEKELGFKDKSEIEAYGIDKFNDKCRDFVFRNIEMAEGWGVLTERMGYWVDLSSAYITCEIDYVESVWWALKQYFDKGLIYKGFKVIPQSPTIATPLSSHELSLGYKEVKDPNCYLKLKIKSSGLKELNDASLVVWTTTPWTLFANVALAVGADIDYVLVLNKVKDKNTEVEHKLVLAEARLSALDGEYEILAKFKGSELLGTEYEQILPFCKIDKEKYPQALTVLEGDFVTTSDGSGIVHLAPAFGEDDYQMSLKNKIPFLQPVTPDGHLTDEAGEFAGRAIKTFTYSDRVEEGVDKDVIIWLKYNDKIYRSTNDYSHSYPHCWRTGNPIMYYARESWFIRSTAYKDRMVELNKQINWQPKEIGEGRFGNWLEEVKDWSLSRDRYWGTPLPIWVNEEDKDDIFAIGSVAELKEGLYEFPDGKTLPVSECGIEIDLHRPFVDNVIFKKDGKTYRRTKEVIDVWFDSGAMFFAQFHYPFENQELFETQFPGDFIAEGIDQTRGWFYTLHNIATAIFDKPAFLNIIVNELILDKNGVKMSKRLGNTADPFDIMDKYGADAVRWYLLAGNPPWRTTLFNEEDIAKTVISDFFRSLTNTYAFFALYANIDGFTGKEETVEYANRPEIDNWIISKLHSLIKEYTMQMDDYDLTKAVRAIQKFVINELSNWYIRRNRRRFWKGEVDDDKIAAYQILREVLVNICALMAPVAPFLSDDLYRRLRKEDDAQSIHLIDMPKADEKLIDIALERKMEVAQIIVSLARFLRDKSKIRVRQPLKRILVPVNSLQERRDIQDVADIILEEINIKDIEFVTDETSNIISKQAKGNFKVIGKKFGKRTQMVANAIKELTNEQIRSLEREQKLEIEVENQKITLELEDVEIYNNDMEGWLVASEGGITIALDTTIDEELEMEGIARELVSKIQNLRKNAGFEVTDRINIELNADEDIRKSIAAKKDYIMNETLAVEIDFKENIDDQIEVDLLDDKIYVKISKVS